MPGLPGLPVLLITLHCGVQIVRQCCARCRACGIVPGMTLAHARALIPDGECRLEQDDPQRDLHALQRLANWAIRYSPVTAPDPPDGLFLNIAGCQRLFHGEHRLLRRIARDLDRLGFEARLACASTFGCAWAAARFNTERITIIPQDRQREALRPLPIEGLRLDSEIIEALHEVEIRAIGDLLILPRRQLAERYGLRLLQRIDQALETAHEVIEPIRPVDPPRVEQVFDGPTTQYQAIELAVRELVQALAQQLLQRESGARRIELDLARIDDQPLRTAIALSQPSRNPKHLWSLLRPRIETMNLGFGVERITLTASSIGRLPHDQSAHWNPRDGYEQHEKKNPLIGELIDTLAGRLGSDRLLMAEPVETHVPELCVRWDCACRPRSGSDPLFLRERAGVRVRRTIFVGQSSTEQSSNEAFSTNGDRANIERLALTPALSRGERESSPQAACWTGRPTSLLPYPEPITLHISLQDSVPTMLRWRGVERIILIALGPERIAAAWWFSTPKVRAATRDYFRLLDEHGLWLWAYRVVETGQWFVHGVWA